VFMSVFQVNLAEWVPIRFPPALTTEENLLCPSCHPTNNVYCSDNRVVSENQEKLKICENE